MHRSLIAVGLSLAWIWSACKPMSADSALKNIFSIDASDPSRRHEASANEVIWTVKSAGCSGLLLSPTLVLSANHCKLRSGVKMKSGWAVFTNSAIDMQVLEVLESNPELDYAIASVKFLNPMPSNQTFPPYIAIKAEDIYASPNKDEGDEVFTVGFPDDKSKEWLATYAQGQLKMQANNRLFFNIGVINGSSGGAILKKENFMLAGIALGGTKAYREAGWDQNSADSRENWNFGTPAWALYQASKILQEQFPGGRNKHYGESFFPKTKIFVALDSVSNGARLKVSTSVESETLLLCAKDLFPCIKGHAGVSELNKSTTASGRHFYSASKELSPEELKGFGLVALDKSGKILGQRKLGLDSGEGVKP